jgi:hypothetical protein
MSGPVLLNGSKDQESACGCFVRTFTHWVEARPCPHHLGEMAVAMFPREKRHAVERALREERP